MALTSMVLVMKPVELDLEQQKIFLYGTSTQTHYLQAFASLCDHGHEHATLGCCGVKATLSLNWARVWDSARFAFSLEKPRIPAVGFFQAYGEIESDENYDIAVDRIVLYGFARPHNCPDWMWKAVSQTMFQAADYYSQRPVLFDNVQEGYEALYESWKNNKLKLYRDR